METHRTTDETAHARETTRKILGVIGPDEEHTFRMTHTHDRRRAVARKARNRRAEVRRLNLRCQYLTLALDRAHRTIAALRAQHKQMARALREPASAREAMLTRQLTDAYALRPPRIVDWLIGAGVALVAVVLLMVF